MKNIRSLVNNTDCIPGVWRVYDPAYFGGEYRYFYSYNYALAFAKRLSNNASTPTAGTHRQNSKSKSKASSVKKAGSPSGG